MKNNLKFSFLLSLFSYFLFLSSCSKVENTKTSNHQEQVLNYIKSLGYPTESIVDAKTSYIVEGDIVFPKSMIVPKDTGRNALTEQYYNGTLVNLAHQIIQVRIDPTLTAQTAEVNAAVSLWNGAHSWVTFQVVANGGQILIRNTNLGPGTCGQGQVPSNGLPGNTVDINAAEVANDNFNERMVNIAHELGHTIGFRHTNGDLGVFGVPVPGWGGTDASSIMNGRMCHSLPTVLSSKDVGAVNALYPNPYPKSPTIDLSYNQFTIRWNYVAANPSDQLIGYDLDYSVQSGISTGGTVHLSPGAMSYTIPGVYPEPTPNNQRGYIYVTLKAVYSSATYAAPTVSKNKVNGIWQ